MKRPNGIVSTTALLVVGLGMFLVLMMMHPPWSLADIHPKGRATIVGVQRAGMILFASYILIAVTALFAYWSGHLWARRLVIFDCFLHLYQLIHLEKSWQHSRVQAVFTLYGACLALYLLWFLFTPEVKGWFMSSAYIPSRKIVRE